MPCFKGVDVIRNTMAARTQDLRLYLDVISEGGSVMSYLSTLFLALTDFPAGATEWPNHGIYQAFRPIEAGIAWRG